MCTTNYAEDYAFDYDVENEEKPAFMYLDRKPKYFNFAGGFNVAYPDGFFDNFYIERVIYNNPATVVFWSDGTKTISKIHGGDAYSPEVGLILCVLKKIHGSTNTRKLLHQWVPESAYSENTSISVSDVRRNERFYGE